MAYDPVHHPSHYEVYPVQPIEITRHLGFCLGNVVKYILRAPYKGGVEDCNKALVYLRLEGEFPQEEMDEFIFGEVDATCERLLEYLRDQPGDDLWDDIATVQSSFLEMIQGYLPERGTIARDRYLLNMKKAIMDLRHILTLRDTTGQIYDGMTGLPGYGER